MNQLRKHKRTKKELGNRQRLLIQLYERAKLQGASEQELRQIVWSYVANEERLEQDFSA